MAGVEDRVKWSAPLKAPAVEIVDLSTEDESVLEPSSGAKQSAEGRDALSPEESQEELGSEVDEEEGSDHDLSMYEDMIDGIDDEGDFDPVLDSDACTPEEAIALRKRLRLLGEDRFITETVVARKITAKKLCTAFGIRPPFFLEGAPDAAFYPLLNLAISRELQKRAKLPQYNTVADAVDLLQKSKNIIVLTGAGISTSLGIPDFRSKTTGLYAQLEHLGLSDPQEVFDISLFREDPSIFYSVAKDILPSSTKFSPTHAFIRLLQDKGKLLSNFTQNIDNLEGHAGILPDKLIQCHGSFATATCLECKHKVDCSAIYDDLKAGEVARCEQCIERIRLCSRPASGPKRKRGSDSRSGSGSRQSRKKNKKKKESWEDSTSDEDANDDGGGDDEMAAAGVMKPDITFFGEDLPARFHDRLINHDREKVDLVVVIGTSLKVAPVSEVVGVIPPGVPQIYISREPCNHVTFDIDLLGDCDTVVTELCRRAGWEMKHEMISTAKVDVTAVDTAGGSCPVEGKQRAKEQGHTESEGEGGHADEEEGWEDTEEEEEGVVSRYRFTHVPMPAPPPLPISTATPMFAPAASISAPAFDIHDGGGAVAKG